MARTVNSETLELSKRLEGLELQAYPDPGSRDGKPVTIGHGTTRINGKPIPLNTTINEAQAEQYHIADLAVAAAVVDRLVKVPLTENQRGALILFTNNVGEGGPKKPGFSTSTLLKKLNAGDYDAVPAELARWKFNDGKVMQGLVNRRAAEAGLWARGSFASSNTVTAKPGNPIRDLATPENMYAGGGLLTGAGALFSGNETLQTFAGVALVIAVLTIAFLVIRKATR